MSRDGWVDATSFLGDAAGHRAACIACAQGSLGAVGDVELGQDGAHVVTDRLRRKVEAFGDLGVRQPLGQQAEDVSLGPGQFRERVLHPRYQLGEVACHPGRNGRSEDPLTAMDRADRLDDLLMGWHP